MQLHTFVADSAAAALAQIRETLGPEAVVLNVRRPPVAGLARLWQQPRIEVLAHVPEPVAPPPVTTPTNELAVLREELRELRQQVQQQQPDGVAPSPESHRRLEEADGSTGESAGSPRRPATGGGWRIGALLEESGLLPLQAERVVEELRSRHGDRPPEAMAEEIRLARVFLTQAWRPSRERLSGTHVFIGAPGSGKTTALCKWLAQTVLVENRTAAVWRLDGHVANMAESLSVFGEILGVPVERSAPANGEVPEADVLFVDWPGVNPGDAAALKQLAQRLREWPEPQVHLVLNAAYELPHWLAQLRAFAALGISDVIATHLDEESRWGKLWNLVLGTNCTVRFLSAGQNIPGEFVPASAERILARQFPRKPNGSVTPAAA